MVNWTLYFPSTKQLTNHEVLTARAYVLMHTYVASENQDLGSHKTVQIKKYCWESIFIEKAYS